MKEPMPSHMADLVARWHALSRWDRAELGRSLRRLGWSYGEIMDVIPVPKGTLADWCRGITLTSEQKRLIHARTGSRRGIPRDTQRRRRSEIEAIRAAAVVQTTDLLDDPVWVAGTVMY